MVSGARPLRFDDRVGCFCSVRFAHLGLLSAAAPTVSAPSEGGATVADNEIRKTPKNQALEALLKAVAAAGDEATRISKGGGSPTGAAAAARDLALAYRYIFGGTQPGSSVIESK